MPSLYPVPCYVPYPECEDRARFVAREVVGYVGRRGRVSCHDLLAAVATTCGVTESEVATALSRVADRLVWHYDAGPVEFGLA